MSEDYVDLEMLTFCAYAANSAEPQAEIVRRLYAEVYAPPPFNRGPAEVAEFTTQWSRRTATSGFRLVLAQQSDEPVGFAFGSRLAPDTLWWSGALDEIPPEFTAEHEGRTFAINDLGVREPWRRRGVARLLHEHLLAGRSEERVTLLVRPSNEAAHRAYASWGYVPVGRVQPFPPDGPVFDALVRTLAATGAVAPPRTRERA